MADPREEQSGIEMGTDPIETTAEAGEGPANIIAAKVTPPPKRQPSQGVKSFRVRTRGVMKFRRAGIMFGPDPTIVSASSLSAEQTIELLNTSTLSVEEIGGDPKKAATKK